ncbi:MAG: hypothetical protein ACLR6B_20015 [Blautia sp.]
MYQQIEKGFVSTASEKYRTIDMSLAVKLQMTRQRVPYSVILVVVDFGIPGTPEADKTTIEKLLPNRLKDQFCFRTQDAVDYLEFIRSDRYGDIKL